jgi:hypothetical protein
MHSFLNLFFNPLLSFYSSWADKMTFRVLKMILFGSICIPFVDFVTVMTLLYLFHYQGMHSIKKTPKDQDAKRGAAILENIPGLLLDDAKS